MDDFSLTISDSFKVYSFDIFDTLLLRPYVSPQEVWQVIEKEENADGFAIDRKRADSITYKMATERYGETSIDEAYKLITKWSHLKQKELDKEREILCPNPEMLKLWVDLGHKGKRRIITSDMYLPKSFLESVLREKGIDGWDAFYLSSDRNARKASGKLYHIILQEEDISPSDMCHIGDNKHSDVQVPSSLGINAVHYPKVSERFFNVCPFVKYSKDKLVGSLILGWHEFICNHAHATFWHRFGYVLGGVLGYLYVTWIVKTAKSLNINHLMFVGRDGFAWKKICDALYPDIRSDYFYAPRVMSIATLGATGNDTNVIRERQEYMESHLQGVSQEEVRQSYREYLLQFTFDEHTAIVDGCSSGFSAQRMVEDALGKKVFCFYLMTFAPLNYGARFYKPNPLPFQPLLEFLFGAPTPPVRWVSKERVQYVSDLSSEEQFKINVSEDISLGIVECAKRLHKDKVQLNIYESIKYCDDFMLHLTRTDKAELSKARNASDLQHKYFSPILFRAIQTKVLTKRLFGFPLYSLRYRFKNANLYYERYLFGRWLIDTEKVQLHDINQITC